MVFSEDEYLAAVRANAPATTQAVADDVGVTRQGADYRLRRMAEDGLVTKQLVGNTLIWSAAEGAETAANPSEPAGDDSPASEPAPRERAQERREPTPEPEPGPLGDVEFPGGKDRAECVEAIEATRDYIREHGGATKKTVVREIMPDHPLGYDVDRALEQVDDPDARFRGAWWRKVVKPGLEALPEIEKPKPGASEWRYVGEE